MRKFLLLIILSFTLLLSQERTEVLQRYDTGEKKVAVKYQGYGLDEKLIERYTFDINGKITKFEDILNPNSYLSQNPHLLNAQGLEDYLKGSWESTFIDSKVDSLDNYITKAYYIFTKDEYSIIANGDELGTSPIIYKNYAQIDDFEFYPISKTELNVELSVSIIREYGVLKMPVPYVFNINLKKINEIPDEVYEEIRLAEEAKKQAEEEKKQAEEEEKQAIENEKEKKDEILQAIQGMWYGESKSDYCYVDLEQVHVSAYWYSNITLYGTFINKKNTSFYSGLYCDNINTESLVIDCKNLKELYSPIQINTYDSEKLEFDYRGNTYTYYRHIKDNMYYKIDFLANYVQGEWKGYDSNNNFKFYWVVNGYKNIYSTMSSSSNNKFLGYIFETYQEDDKLRDYEGYRNKYQIDYQNANTIELVEMEHEGEEIYSWERKKTSHNIEIVDDCTFSTKINRKTYTFKKEDCSD